MPCVYSPKQTKPQNSNNHTHIHCVHTHTHNTLQVTQVVAESVFGTEPCQSTTELTMFPIFTRPWFQHNEMLSFPLESRWFCLSWTCISPKAAWISEQEAGRRTPAKLGSPGQEPCLIPNVSVPTPSAPSTILLIFMVAVCCFSRESQKCSWMAS